MRSMNAFRYGFAAELLTPPRIEKRAEPAGTRHIPITPEQLRQIKKGLMRGAGGAAGAALLYKLINPGIDTGQALASGGAMVGGGSLGGYSAKRMGLGRRGQGLGSVIGSVAALRALHKHRKDRR